MVLVFRFPNGTALASWLPWTLNSTPWRNDRSAVTRLAGFSGCRRYRPDQTDIACAAASSIWGGGEGLEMIEWRSLGKQSSVRKLLTNVRQWSGIIQPQSCWWRGGDGVTSYVISIATEIIWWFVPRCGVGAVSGVGAGQKTETDWHRGLFNKTQPKPTDLGQCKTVTTLVVTEGFWHGGFIVKGSFIRCGRLVCEG